MANYRCPTLGDCDRANAGEIFTRAPGDDLKCPGCGVLLEEIVGKGVNGGGGVPKAVLLSAVVAGVLLLIGGTWFALHQLAVFRVVKPLASTDNAALNTPASSAGAALPTASAPSGMMPSEAEALAKRQASEKALLSGKAAKAEMTSNQAAAIELIKVAVAKLNQGKLTEAEKDLQAAQERDPAQPLTYYNLAVLRLSQNRVDDSLKEFETCFKSGFKSFDQLDIDKDLQKIRADKRFVDLLTKYRPK